MTQQEFKYFAFISYNSKDTEWGKRLQRKLEHYRMPSTLCSEHGWERTPINPVFFAPTDIQPGGLTEELQERLRASRNMIVICSPNSARSEWVGKEIEFFHLLGRTKQIHFFIVEGTPHSGNHDTECFNPIADTLGLPEILGANIHEKIYRWPWMNKERAYVQLISKLLGVEFDAIWQRHKRLLIQKAIAWTIGILSVVAALVGVWVTNQPVDVEVRLKEMSFHNKDLPPMSESIITVHLDNEQKTDTISSMDGSIRFTNIPHSALGKMVRMTINSRDSLFSKTFLPVDTMVKLSEQMTLGIYRNEEPYGRIIFDIWDVKTEKLVPGIDVEVDGLQATTDKNGHVEMFIPLERQKSYYILNSSVPLENDTLMMPCNIGSVPTLIVK